jgi:hypothetical protein
METTLCFDYLDQMWYVWTNVQTHITKFQKQGWKMTDAEYDGDRIVAARFEAPKRFITIGNVARKKRSGNVGSLASQ